MRLHYIKCPLYWHHCTYLTAPGNMIFARILSVLLYVNLTLCRNSIQFTFFLVMRLNIIIVTEGTSFIIMLAWNVASKNTWIIKLVLIFNTFLKYVVLPLFYKEVVWNSFPVYQLWLGFSAQGKRLLITNKKVLCSFLCSVFFCVRRCNSAFN